MEEVKAEVIDYNTNYKRSKSDITKLNVAIGFLIANIVVTPIYVLTYYDYSIFFSSAAIVVTLAIQIAYLVNTIKIKKGVSPNTTFGGVTCLFLGNIVSGILRLCCEKD